MQIAPAAPRPAELHVTPATPPVALDADAVQLDSLPDELEYRINLPVRSTTMWGDDQEWPIDDWYAAPSDYEQPWHMQRGGIRAALAGADELSARTGMPVAVVQQGTDGNRLLVPVGVWNPVDESELSFEDAGGLPYFNGAADHVLVGRNAADDPADVEALVFNDGARSGWVNLSGHPIRP